jgi:hypothetical protein
VTRVDVVDSGRAVWSITGLLASLVAAITVTRAVVCWVVSLVTMTVDLASPGNARDVVLLGGADVVATERVAACCAGAVAATTLMIRSGGAAGDETMRRAVAGGATLRVAVASATIVALAVSVAWKMVAAGGIGADTDGLVPVIVAVTRTWGGFAKK